MSRVDVTKEVQVLERMSVGELRQRYVDVFGEAVRSRHKRYLIRRIAWRLQANAEGGLSERALRRAGELANVADVRVTAPRVAREAVRCSSAPSATPRDRRLPPPGTALARRYKGRTVSVIVLPDGFEHDGERYKSLSAVAKTITGSHLNGFRFFGLEGQP